MEKVNDKEHLSLLPSIVFCKNSNFRFTSGVIERKHEDLLANKYAITELRISIRQD